MARIAFRPLWTVEVQHAFFGGACDALEFIVPPSTQRALAGAHAMARVRQGRLHVLYEVDEADQPLAALAGRRFLFGLRPRDASFGTITAAADIAPADIGAGDAALWRNAPSANALAGPAPVLLCTGLLRITPRNAARPLQLRLFDDADTLRSQATLSAADERWLPQVQVPAGAWRLEEDDGNTPPASRALQVAPDLAGAWGLLELTVAPAHLAGGRTFTLAFAAREDRLRYYVVASRFGAAEFNAVQVVDNGAAAEGRPAIAFTRVPSSDFGPTHLPPALLDPAGGARIALFESQAPVARRQRGPAGLELHRNGDLLVGHLPQPGADRPDAQFIVHLSQP